MIVLRMIYVLYSAHHAQYSTEAILSSFVADIYEKHTYMDVFDVCCGKVSMGASPSTKTGLRCEQPFFHPNHHPLPPKPYEIPTR